MSVRLRFKSIAKRKGYIIYKKPFKLNIWGVRSKTTQANKFDDTLHVFFTVPKQGQWRLSDLRQKKKSTWRHYIFPITTDPGTYWLNNPMNPKGTAILAPGQYLDTYKIDLHRSNYYALCQKRGKVNVIRDYDRNAVLDFQNGKYDSGMFGINIHRAKRTGNSYTVDNHSAGCQVFQRANDFAFFMKLCEIHRGLHGNTFTYTLIDERMAFRAALRKLSLATFGIGALGMGYWYLDNKTKN